MAFSVLYENGGGFSRGLWQEMAWAVRIALDSGGEASKTARKWIPLLIDQAPARRAGNLLWVLQGCDPLDDPHGTLLLFDRLLEPGVALSRFNIGDGGRSLEIRINARSWGLKTYWEENLRPSLREWALAMDMAVIADRNLRAALWILAANGDPETEWFWVNRSRSAIEDSEENRLSLHEGMDLLVTIARDTLEALLEHHPEQAHRYLHSWGESPIPLLRRLALHGWSERRDATADEGGFNRSLLRQLGGWR